MNDKVVMPIWTFGLFIVVMNTTMFNVSIPGIIQDLHISTDLGSWVISSYSIGYALSTVIYSRLSDVIPIRRLLAVGLAVLGLSSVYGLFANSFEAVLAARILQSAGAGAMAGLGLVLASRYIPYERRGRAIAMISAGSAMAFGLGPIVGGLISEYWGWNGVFGVTVLVLAVLPVLFVLLPKEKPQPFRFDMVGAILTVSNAATLLIAVMQRSFLWLAISVISLLLHAWHLRRAKETFVNPSLLRNSSYRKLLTVGFCILVLNLGNLFLMPLVLADLFHKSPLLIGMMIAPGAILSAFLTRFVGRWIDRYGNLKFLLIGQVVLACVLTLFALDVPASPLIILCGYLFFSPAFSATMASLNNETSRILPKQAIGSGMGLMQLIQFFGGSFSVAVCGLLLSAQADLPIAEAYQHVYGILLAVCILSLAVMVWYQRTSTTARVSSAS
ncbi:DHA2 family metal-tetracycline-proton antiporter-like MFS transporter [Paenibacillus phyllosphaerae]|uniref:DHA2 family metal-tetracycline-proton antiporter-like MFS transporter n=1 Tax=Paenibacillus phyllosphaerae TaxID=274593 RepID=A0A7W5AYT6_9BACL|nr:MFS transporter [Paenibacillus phyllosphaerae]MBB3111233.1 DHA2 family metal-tetracycline-proton antiporter-like MFS transporter [Paenibacillus phyllosphaerae]